MPSKTFMVVVTPGMSMFKVRLTIRRRLLLLFLLLTFFPLFAYRFALDLQHLLLNHQAQTQQQTVQQLALILQTRPELWGQTLATQQTLPHLDLTSGSIWLVNTQGQTNYVMGHLGESKPHHINGLEWLGQAIIGGLSGLFGQNPLPFPQNAQPEKQLIAKGLAHIPSQYYRTDPQGHPVSLMSASPLYSPDSLIGVIIYEQLLDTIFNQTLSHFYYLVGLGASLFLVFMTGVIAYATSLSKRVLNLSDEVKSLFLANGQLKLSTLPSEPTISQDELSDLRAQINDLLTKLIQYDRYLKQLPKTLRHELHTPINRMSLAMQNLALEHTGAEFESLNHGLTQLKQIICALSEAGSFEQALSQPNLTPIELLPRVVRYFQQVEQGLAPGLVKLVNRVEQQNTLVLADGFMLEQLFDKLLDNALAFNDQREPIEIRLFIEDGLFNIEVANSGPRLPQGFEKHIFEGMVSIRDKSTDSTHLGLGLYVAKLIANAHQAELSARNQTHGVVFKLSLPINSYGP